MRIHPVYLLLVVTLSALVQAATPTTCLDGCKCDEDLLKNNKLKIEDCDTPITLKGDVFSSVPKNIVVLSFKNVEIEKIEEDAFTAFDVLDVIIVEDSTIGSIHRNAFNLLELRAATFIKTTFAESPSLSAEYLEELIFNNCQLSQVPSLDYLPGLTFLNLANNLIKEIDESAFTKAKNLEEITLTNNSITKLPPNIFKNNQDFSVLTLDNNPLTSFELSFSSEVELLSLKNCKITNFDRRVTENLRSLSTLHLSGNEISILPIDAFEPMEDLRDLDLSNNKLVELDDDIFLENSKLDKIVLDNNPFAKLPNFQTKSKGFQFSVFSCKNCSLTSVQGVFNNVALLTTLNLADNKLKTIDGVFGETAGPTELFLSNNQITTIGINSFGKDSKLETLDLSQNPLSPLDPVVFASLQSLKTLNVSSCGLKTLWANYNAEIPKLEKIYIGKNEISTIATTDIQILPKLKLINLKENPLSCTPDLYDLVDYLTKKSVSAQEGAVITHEELSSGSEVIQSPRLNWRLILPTDCIWIDSEDDGNEYDDDDFDVDDPDGEATEYSDEEDDYDDEDEKDDGDGVEASVINTGGFNLAKASYILSITSVFILTALLVLFVAVVTTLLILKRNKSFNMHNGNLPRLKIPLWHTTPGQKKHSGSVYKPLSEDLSGPRTPIINRYDFKQTPQVHNSLP